MQGSSIKSTNIQISQSSSSRNYQSQAVSQAVLQWSSLGQGRESFVVSSQSDFLVLKNLKNVLLTLLNQFNQGGSSIVLSGNQRDDFNKRLILLENQIQGLMKRKIEYSGREGNGSRNLDYTGILNEKQNQIVELQKKINNLQERLRKASAREIELQNEVTRLYSQIKIKDKIIFSKNQIILSEVSSSNLLREALQKSGIQLPNIGSLDIRADSLTVEGATSRTSSYQNLPQNKKNKTQLISFFRQLEKINNSEGISDEEIQRALEGFITNLQGSKWRESVQVRMRRRKIEQEYERLQNQFGAAVGIFQAQMDKIKQQNSGIRIETDQSIYKMLKDHKINVYKTSGDVVHLERYSERTIQVPVQDARTKHLMHLLAVQMKKFTSKYPKLNAQMDVRLSQFFQQELIDIIEVDEIDRLVQIVKYVPQVVKVENVYAYSSEKTRKVEFHLRVLIKALLEQLQKIKRRTGVVLQIDQGVVGMINQEIMGVVDVDDILKVFRVVPKIVEVQKIVQKIVDRIVQVPTITVVQKIVQKIVQIQKIRQVQRNVNVPLQIPSVVTNIVQKIVPVQKIVERIIEVPQIIERIIQVVRQVPKVVEVERIVEKIVQVEKVVQVERVVNHVQEVIKEVQVIKEVVVPSLEKIVQRIVQVPVIVQKIVQKIVHVPQIIEVIKIEEKIVPQIQYRPAREIQNHIEVRHEIVERIVEKPIPIIQTVERIVQVPQIVEKIVEVKHIVTEIRQVQVIIQKIVVQERIRTVQVIKEIPVVQIKQIIKQVERIVQVPIIHEKIKVVTQIVEKAVVQRIQNTIIKEVYLRDPLIVREPKIVQVQKIINHYIQVPKPIKYIEEKIVEVIRHVDRIKQIKVPVQKIIQKMVQVPKVVEVERIVQKIVVVPRVVQKIIQVPQIVERVVPKIIIEQRIKQVERIIEKPVIQERITEVEVIKNVYIEVQKIVQKIMDKLVQVPRYEEKIINHEVIVEKVIQVIKQIPRQMEVQKIVTNTVQTIKQVPIQRQIIIPVEVPVPVQKIIQKIVPVPEIIEKVVSVPAVMEKIVAQNSERVETVQIVRYEEKIVIDQKIKQVVKEVPYIQDKIKQVEVIREKIVPIQTTVQQVVTAQQIIQKIVQKTITVPKIHQVQRVREVMVQVSKLRQIQKIVPQLVNVNRYIQSIVQKIVQVPIIVEQLKEVIRQNEKIVQVRNQYETIKEVQRIVEKSVIMEKFKEVVRNINHIEKVLQIVDRYEQTPVSIISHEERLVEVPYILEKIVQKIVIMPQIVQVLKYVHEVVEQQTLGVAVGVDVSIHQQRYKVLGKQMKVNLDILLTQIRKLKLSNPNLSIQIEIIQKFMRELEQFILFPRIVEIAKEKIVQKVVEKDNIVRIPTQDQRSIKMQLTLSLLVEQLIGELKKVKKANPSVNFELEDDVKLIFFSQLDSVSRSVGDDFNNKLKQFSDSVYRKFESLGSWSYDHQLMLNSFLQERFLMANLVKNANLQIEKSKHIQVKREQALKRSQSDIVVLQGVLSKIRGFKYQGISIEQESLLKNIFSQFDIYRNQAIVSQPMRDLLDLQINDQRIQSLIREKDSQINRLKDRIFSIERSRGLGNTSQSQNEIIRVLQSENLKLKNQITEIRTSKGSAELVASYKLQVQGLNNTILKLEQEKSDLNAELLNLKKEYEVKLQFSTSSIIKDSVATQGRSEFRSPQHLSSPVNRYPMNSPNQTTDYGIRMVDSKIQENKPTYGSSGMTDSRLSSQSGQQATYQIGGTSGVSGFVGSGTGVSGFVGSGIGVTGTIGVSNLNVQKTSQYGQSGLNTTYQSGTYQYGSSSGQLGGSNLYSSTTSRESGSNSGAIYQSGSYQPGSSFQSGINYQRYQGQSGSSSTQGGQGSSQTGQGGNTGGSSSYSSSSYTYKKP